MMKEQGIPLGVYEKRLEALADEGKTPMIFAEENKIIGILAVADVVKPTSRQAVQQLKELGIEVVMLTGDNKRTAEAIRKKLDIDTVIAEVMPQDKERDCQTSGAGKNSCHDRRRCKRCTSSCKGGCWNGDWRRNRRCH